MYSDTCHLGQGLLQHPSQYIQPPDILYSVGLRHRLSLNLSRSYEGRFYFEGRLQAFPTEC